jgi:hypothetical protein
MKNIFLTILLGLTVPVYSVPTEQYREPMTPLFKGAVELIGGVALGKIGWYSFLCAEKMLGIASRHTLNSRAAGSILEMVIRHAPHVGAGLFIATGTVLGGACLYYTSKPIFEMLRSVQQE